MYIPSHCSIDHMVNKIKEVCIGFLYTHLLLCGTEISSLCIGLIDVNSFNHLSINLHVIYLQQL